MNQPVQDQDLYPFAVEAFDLRGYDLVISISHCAAKGVITAPHSLHISYVLTPMRYAWVLGDEYFGGDRMNRSFKAVLAPVLSALRTWDAILALPPGCLKMRSRGCRQAS